LPCPPRPYGLCYPHRAPTAGRPPSSTGCANAALHRHALARLDCLAVPRNLALPNEVSNSDDPTPSSKLAGAYVGAEEEIPSAK